MFGGCLPPDMLERDDTADVLVILIGMGSPQNLYLTLLLLLLLQQFEGWRPTTTIYITDTSQVEAFNSTSLTGSENLNFRALNALKYLTLDNFYNQGVYCKNGVLI